MTQLPDGEFKQRIKKIRNMTFMADAFVTCEDYGFRWEEGFKVTKDGCEPFSDKRSEIIEL